MNLNVVQPAAGKPWYAGGLTFTCTQCGNCCTGGPGFVWITTEEIRRLAEFLHLTPEETVEKYCRKIDGKFSLKEARNRGSYDCVFLREENAPRSARAAEGHDEAVCHTKRSCAIYAVRPLQCRTWPFWESNLESPERWRLSAQRCHGMNRGPRRFSLKQIEAIRDAADWPKNPPSSKPR